MNYKKLAVLLLTGMTATTFNPSKVEALLAGVRTTGMAATSVAYPIDAFSGVYNPANITLLEDRLDTGFSVVHTSQGAKIKNLPNYEGTGLAPLLALGVPNPTTENGSRNGARTAYAFAPEFGVCKKFCLEATPWKYPVEFSTSFTLYNRSDLKTTYTKPFGLFGCSKLGLEYIHQTAAFTLATKICTHHSVGLSINYNVQRLKIDGVEKFACSYFSTSPENATNRGYNYSNGAGVTLGYLFDWNNLKIGGSWQPNTHMKRFNKYKGFVAGHGAFNLPERYTAGISYQFPCQIAAAFDFEFIRWRQIRQLKNPVFPNLYDHLLGSNEGAGFGFKNQKFYRFGVEKRFENFSLRAGFRHSKTPVTPANTATNVLTLDLMENVATFGGSYKLCANQEVSFYCAIGIEKEVKGRNSIPIMIPQPIPSDPTTCGSPCLGRTNVPLNADPATSALPATFTQGDGELDIRQKRSAVGVAWTVLF